MDGKLELEKVLAGKRLLLIVAGGIAAYKVLDLVRRLKERGMSVRAILTKGGREFVTPLSLAALTGEKVYEELFSLTDETEMGHIQLSRRADLVLVAPASADILAKMAGGIAGDLATTALLATDKPVLVAPAMNPEMWDHPATRRNVAQLKADGIGFIGPAEGDMACGEVGAGRLSEPAEILAAITVFFAAGKPLAGLSALVTSGPTHEAIDPVRFIANRSSGKQGHAIAAALADAGAATTLISGPTALPDPRWVTTVHVETAREMLAACEAALPADLAVCAAAVADWRVTGTAEQKLKKGANQAPPELRLEPNPDILAQLSQQGVKRPRLVIGFAAETENLIENAKKKRAAKGCDWILANEVTAASGVFGGARNTIHLIDATGEEAWPQMEKHEVARRLTDKVAAFFAKERPAA